jgi:TolB-like protein
MKKYIFAILLIALFSLGITPASAEDKRGITTIAIVPFDNLSGEDLPLDFTQALYDYFKGTRFKIIAQDRLEHFFIKRRVRRTRWVSREIVRELGETLGADALIMGSINLLSEGENPRVDVSAQMVDTLDSSIIWVNSVVCSGNDFATFLGIGKIRSLKQLVEIAINDLLRDIPVKDTSEGFEGDGEKNRGTVPFEIVQASFYPTVAQGGKSVGLMIEVREISERPTYMNAIVQDKDVPLFFDGNRWYSGSFISPRAEGVYTLKLYVAGKPNKVFLLDALASLVVDNTPPIVTIASHTVLISPNNDGINDYALFSPALLRADIMKGWRFEVRDKHGGLVRSAEGGGELPKSLIWRGENDAFTPAEDGNYFVQLIIRDQADHETATDKVMVTVDRTSPAVEISPSAIEGEVVTFNVNSKGSSDILEWNVIIYDQDDETIGTFNGKLNLPPTFSCTVKKKVLTFKKILLPIHLQYGMPRGICQS